MQPSKADEISRAVPYAVGQRSEQATEKEGFGSSPGRSNALSDKNGVIQVKKMSKLLYDIDFLLDNRCYVIVNTVNVHGTYGPSHP